eukprot:65429-Hanusia_phi.AAC.2
MQRRGRIAMWSAKSPYEEEEEEEEKQQISSYKEDTDTPICGPDHLLEGAHALELWREDAAAVIGSALYKAEYAGKLSACVVQASLGDLEVEKHARTEMRVRANGDDALYCPKKRERQLRPVLARTVELVDEMLQTSNPFVTRLEEKSRSILKPLDDVLVDIEACNSPGARILQFCVQEFLNSLEKLGALEPKLAMIEEQVEERITRPISSRLKRLSQWGDKVMGVAYPVGPAPPE